MGSISGEQQDQSFKGTSDVNEDGWPDRAVYCKECLMWLNGRTQWEDHKIGKRHRKNLKQLWLIEIKKLQVM